MQKNHSEDYLLKDLSFRKTTFIFESLLIQDFGATSSFVVAITIPFT